MNIVEFDKFIEKIKAYYPMFKLTTEGTNEWKDVLSKYETADILRVFSEWIYEHPDAQPKLQLLTKYLKTKEEKKTNSTDYLIRCDLCGKEMRLSVYENSYRDRCLLIKSLQSAIKEKKGVDVSYEELDGCTMEILRKLEDKYIPMPKSLNDILNKF